MRHLILPAATVFTMAASSVLAQEAVLSSQSASELRVDWVLGARVTSLEGETIGSIQDVILDTDEGVVTAAVISVGGFLGFGAKNIAVEWDALEIDWDASEISLALTREQADEAEEYIFRDREFAPPEPPPMGTGGGTMGRGAGTGAMGGGTAGGGLN